MTPLNPHATKRKIEALQNEAQQLQQDLNRLQQNCHHQWGAPISTPEPTREWVYDGLEVHGSDTYPKGHYIDGPSKPCWTRTCGLCGVEQKTHNTKPTNFVPHFES